MGTLYVVATPIGNLSDITIRALDILKSVDYIAAEDTRQTIKILNKFDIRKKMIAYHKFNEQNKIDILIEDLKKGKNIALVSDAGTPCISDPGYLLIKSARENDINVYSIPGASAVISALSISGINSQFFSFIGFFPIDNKKKANTIELIKNSEVNTFIIYESPRRIVSLIRLLMVEFPLSKVYIASDLTKKMERGFYGNIKEVYDKIKADEKITKGEYTVVFEKNYQKEKKEELSIEALLIDEIIKNKCTIKEGIENLANKNKELKKNEIYRVSLSLRENIVKLLK